MASELAKINIEDEEAWASKILHEIRRENKGMEWDNAWKRAHIPIANRVRKVDGKYVVAPCPHCGALNGK